MLLLFHQIHFGGFQDCAALILVVIESMTEVSLHFRKLCTDKFHFYKFIHFTLQRNHTTRDKGKELVLHPWVSSSVHDPVVRLFQFISFSSAVLSCSILEAPTVKNFFVLVV